MRTSAYHKRHAMWLLAIYAAAVIVVVAANALRVLIVR